MLQQEGASLPLLATWPPAGEWCTPHFCKLTIPGCWANAQEVGCPCEAFASAVMLCEIPALLACCGGAQYCTIKARLLCCDVPLFERVFGCGI